MPDFPNIQKCKGEGCPEKESCFRFKVHYDDDPYFTEIPYKQGLGYCVYFWRMEDEEC